MPRLQLSPDRPTSACRFIVCLTNWKKRGPYAGERGASSVPSRTVMGRGPIHHIEFLRGTEMGAVNPSRERSNDQLPLSNPYLMPGVLIAWGFSKFSAMTGEAADAKAKATAIRAIFIVFSFPSFPNQSYSYRSIGSDHHAHYRDMK